MMKMEENGDHKNLINTIQMGIGTTNLKAIINNGRTFLKMEAQLKL